MRLLDLRHRPRMGGMVSIVLISAAQHGEVQWPIRLRTEVERCKDLGCVSPLHFMVGHSNLSGWAWVHGVVGEVAEPVSSLVENWSIIEGLRLLLPAQVVRDANRA